MDKPSIFIVEDEVITAKSIAKNIRKFGYHVAGLSTSGSQALKEILEVKPDLILMDIQLAKNAPDGIAIATRIKSQLDVPIIYLTAHSDRETLDRAKITSPFGYILKPYSKKDLEIGIEFALHKHHQEKQLTQREKLLSTILNATQDGVVATNGDSQITYMNPAAEKITGWKLAEARNNPAEEIIQIIDERDRKSLKPIEKVLERGKVIYLDEYAVLLTKNGTSTKISDSASPILTEDEEPEGAVLIFTPRRNLAASHSTLSNNEQLKDLSTYLMNLILHELRSPLTTILTTSQSLQSYRQKWTIEKQDSRLTRIQRAIRQMTRLLDNVAIWDELGKEEWKLNPEWIDATTLSQELLSDLEQIDEQNHNFVLSYQGEQLMVFLDPDILQYILRNLLLNSMKYSGENSTIYLLIKYQADFLTVQVQDRGMGIPLAEQKQIFEPLYRASNTGKIKGTGLGLAIVREYVRLCKGEISLKSSPDSGTVFVVRFPLSDLEQS